MFRARHLRDDRLFDCYVAERGGEPLDPRTADHLADCTNCRARYMDLSAFMSGLRAEADAEIDAVFSPDALRAQQQHIASRIEHLGHAARVISFPAHQTNDHAGLAARVSSLAPRWIAAAAVAGLVVGVGVGSVFQSGGRFSRVRPPAPATGAPAATSVPIARPETAAADDEFLSELELALERPHPRELLALDELTPRVRALSVSNVIR